MTGLGLKGKRVIVTGAAGGLGRTFAVAFADAGARIVAADVNISGADETARMIADSGGEAHACRVDVTDALSLAALALCARDKLGGLDCLVNNAAVYAGLARKSFETITEAEWDRVMAVNVKGAWMAIKATAPLLREADHQHIVCDGDERLADVAALCVIKRRHHSDDPSAGAGTRRRSDHGQCIGARLHSHGSEP